MDGGKLGPAFALGTICGAQSGGNPPHGQASAVPCRTNCPGGGSTIQLPVNPVFNVTLITLNSTKFKWIQADSSKSSRGIPPFQSLSRRLGSPTYRAEARRRRKPWRRRKLRIWSEVEAAGQTLSNPVKPFLSLDHLDHEHPSAPVFAAIASGASESRRDSRQFADQNHPFSAAHPACCAAIVKNYAIPTRF